MVDTQGVEPNEESQCPTCTVHPMAGCQSVHVQGRRSIPFIVHDAGTDRRETGIITGPRVSTLCLPDVIAHDQISHASLHPYLHTASDQILAVGIPGNEANSILSL